MFKILNQSQALSFAFDMQSLMFQVSAFDGTGLDDLNMEASALDGSIFCLKRRREDETW